MRLFKWRKTNAVFIPEIDAEHQELFRIAEELHEAAEAGAETPRLLAIFRELTGHAEAHFEHEESLMRATNCPSYEWHIGQHNTSRKRIRQFAPQIEQGDTQALQLLLEFLSGWLNDHTSLTDRMMAAHVRNYGRAHALLAS
jgi:hemerythrin